MAPEVAATPAPVMPAPVRVAEAAPASQPAEPVSLPAALPAGGSWESSLEAEAQELLASGRHDVWDELTRRFESRLILTALSNTRGRRIEAAQKLGIGRNTITRKIQELGLE
jgi:two-component system nitrogen regulation response regulator GlnG